MPANNSKASPGSLCRVKLNWPFVRVAFFKVVATTSVRRTLSKSQTPPIKLGATGLELYADILSNPWIHSFYLRHCGGEINQIGQVIEHICIVCDEGRCHGHHIVGTIAIIKTELKRGTDVQRLHTAAGDSHGQRIGPAHLVQGVKSVSRRRIRPVSRVEVLE